MKVALFGTGLMGYPMAVRLLKAGHELTVYNRSFQKAAPLKNWGAVAVRRPEKAIADAQCIILMLADAPAIANVLFSDNVALKGKTVIQMGTIAPSESIAFAKKVKKQGGAYLECPVLGSRKEAKAAVLLLMVGSTQEQFDKWSGFLECFGPEPLWIGEVGKAAALKLALNQLIASLISSFALSLAFVQAQGVKVDDFMKILRQSVLYAPTFDKKLPSMLQHQYTNPNFSTRNMLKDVRLFLKEARGLRLSAENLAGVEKILVKAMRKFSNEDYCSIFESIRNPSQ